MLRSSLFLGRRAFSRGSLATPPAPFLALPKTAAIVGAPFNLGQPLLGVEAGPNAVRQVRGPKNAEHALWWWALFLHFQLSF